MKTYDEVFQNVIEATNAHHRKVRKIQNAVSASVVCAVCVIGASMYLKLEKPETVPPDTETTTATITETMDASSTGQWINEPTELTFTTTNTIPASISTVISGTNQTQETVDMNHTQETTIVTAETATAITSEEGITTFENHTSIIPSSTQTTPVTNTETKPTVLTTSETKHTYTTYTTHSNATETSKDASGESPPVTLPTTEPIAEPTDPTEPSVEPTEPIYTTGNLEPEPSGTIIESSGIFTTATTPVEATQTTEATQSETILSSEETTTTETTTTEAMTTQDFIDTGEMIIQPEYAGNPMDETEPVSVYIDMDVALKQTLTEVVRDFN